MNIKDQRMIVFTAFSKHNFYLKDVIQKFVLENECVPINPFKQFGYFLGDIVERDLIKRANNSLILGADELWVFGDISDGVTDEIELAISNSKRIRFFYIDAHGLKIKEYYDTHELKFEDNVSKPDTMRLRIMDYIEGFQKDRESLEIERKWLLKEIPYQFELLIEAEAEQAYLSVDPEVRIRKKVNKGYSPTFFMDVKSDGELIRKEITVPIQENDYEEIKKVLDTPVIMKNWFLFQLDENHHMEATIVDPGTENEFIYAEIEFASEQEANDFIMPISEAVEVTSNADYKMKNYWKRTRT